jgi:tetratricopeptide (TPR) repeat protein
MKFSLKNSILLLGVITISNTSFAQKKNETSAAVVYKNQFMPAMMRSNIDAAKKSLIEAKEFIDLAAVHEDTKSSQKTLWLKGEIYASFLTVGMQSMDTSFIALAGEDAIATSAAAFKKGFPLGKKYKSEINNAVIEKILMINGLAGTLYGTEQFEEAAQLYEYQAMYNDAIDVLDSSAIYNASLCYEKSSKFTKAAEGYEKLSKVGYRGTTSAILASSAYRRAGNIDKAKEVIAEARKTNPSDKDLLLELVNTNIDAGDAAGAEKALSDAIKNDPNNKRLYYTIGTIYIDLGENQKAEDALTKALEIDSNYANAQYQLGAHLVGWAGDLNTDARKLKLGDPSYDQMIKQSQEAYGRAVSPLENYISNYPEDKAVLNILFQLHRNLGNSEKALEYKKKAEGL